MLDDYFSFYYGVYCKFRTVGLHLNFSIDGSYDLSSISNKQT